LALEAAIRQGRTVLFSLDAAAYPLEAAKVGAWALMDLVRVAGLLQEDGWGVGHQAYFVIDELSALREEGRHVVPVLARAREAGIACVVATQGLADLTAINRAMPQQVVQNTAVKILLQQRSAEDATARARHGGEYEREEWNRTYDHAGERSCSTRWRRDFYVSPDDLRVLGTGDAVVWVAPLGRQPGKRFLHLRGDVVVDLVDVRLVTELLPEMDGGKNLTRHLRREGDARQEVADAKPPGRRDQDRHHLQARGAVKTKELCEPGAAVEPQRCLLAADGDDGDDGHVLL